MNAGSGCANNPTAEWSNIVYCVTCTVYRCLPTRCSGTQALHNGTVAV